MADDRLRGLRENVDQQGTSPWSEYRRLVLAELERINNVIEALRRDSIQQQTQIAVLQDRIAECARTVDAARGRIESLVRQFKEEANGVPRHLQSRLERLEENQQSLREKVGGVAIASAVIMAIITIAATIWNAWLK